VNRVLPNALRGRPGAHGDLLALLTAADATAPMPERHTWLLRLGQWLRGARGGDDTGLAATTDATPRPALRLKHLALVLERNPEQAERVGLLFARIAADADVTALLADVGFAPRPGLATEVARRVRRHLLPGTPVTQDMGELFALLQPTADDAEWIAAIDGDTLDRLGAVLRRPGRPSPAVLDAITYLASAVRAAGFSSELRPRMDPTLMADRPFMQLARAVDRWRDAVEAGDTPRALQEARHLHALLERCRAAAASIAAHLEQHGVSMSLVHDVDQLQGRTRRIGDLMALAMASLPGAGPRDWHAPMRHLLAELARAAEASRSVRALLAQHSSLLARKVAERSAETGEHYITRTPAEYRHMLGAAAGGGAVLAFTTYAKFAIMAFGLGTFWSGFWAGLNYAVSFLVVMALHWTVATKQPAMTAPAMAAKLRDLGDDAKVEGFVDEVAHLIRSQIAGIAGNLGMVAPLVLAAQAIAWWWLQQPLIPEAKAQYVLHSLTLLGPTALYAAFTGVLLFVSSLIAGWAENAFVWHRLDSAIAWNPRIVDRLGAARAQRWAAWWRRNVSGVVANVSLGLMLGLVPAVLQLLGVPLDVRHVTLSTGQLAAAVGTLGHAVLSTPDFWWCVAGLAATGALNLGVSFSLAFAVALRSRGLHQRDRRLDRQRIGRAMRRRLATAPSSFLWSVPRPRTEEPAP
jgi:site-specific recombinase